MARQSLIFLAILIGPIYLAQAGLKLTTPVLSSTILAIGPIATLALQSTVGGVTLSPAMLAVTALYSIVAITAAVITSADVSKPPRLHVRHPQQRV
jgi:hypothetical protein